MNLPATLLALALLALPAAAQEAQTITFPAGNTSTTIKSSITGGDYFDYRVAATSGQVLKIDVTGNSNVFFNVLPPNDDVAIHNSSNDFEATASVNLPRDGTYVVRVYLQGEDESDEKTVPYVMTLKLM